MHFLLDTNVCIEILRGRNLTLKSRLAEHALDELALCSIVWAELLCGARLARDPEAELNKVHRAFDAWRRLEFDDASALRYAEIRAHLQREGRLIGCHDLLIASIALAHDLTLVTHNHTEFERVPGLKLVDWQI